MKLHDIFLGLLFVVTVIALFLTLLLDEAREEFKARTIGPQ